MADHAKTIVETRAGLVRQLRAAQLRVIRLKSDIAALDARLPPSIDRHHTEERHAGSGT